jgi:hypothetical protein
MSAVGVTDVLVEAKVNFKTFTSTSAIAYLATRFIDLKNYYFLEFHADGSMKIRRKIAGSSTDLLMPMRTPACTASVASPGLPHVEAMREPVVRPAVNASIASVS